MTDSTQLFCSAFRIKTSTMFSASVVELSTVWNSKNPPQPSAMAEGQVSHHIGGQEIFLDRTRKTQRTLQEAKGLATLGVEKCQNGEFLVNRYNQKKQGTFELGKSEVLFLGQNASSSRHTAFRERWATPPWLWNSRERNSSSRRSYSCWSPHASRPMGGNPKGTRRKFWVQKYADFQHHDIHDSGLMTIIMSKVWFEITGNLWIFGSPTLYWKSPKRYPDQWQHLAQKPASLFAWGEVEPQGWMILVKIEFKWYT